MKKKLYQVLAAPESSGSLVSETVHRSLFLFLAIVLIANTRANGRHMPTCPTIWVTLTSSPNVGCVGSVLTLDASTIVGGTAPYTYTWSGPNGFSATGSTSSATTAPLTTTGEGNYHVTVTDVNGCSSGSGTGNKFVGVWTIPVLSAVATPNPVCTGNTIFLTAGYNSGGSGVCTYAWTGPNGYSGTGANPTIDNATSAAAGVYSVAATDVSSGCIGRGTTSPLSVITNTVTLAVSSPVYLCSGSSTTLAVTGASTYNWNPMTGLSSGVGSSVTANPTSSTTYAVTGHVGNCYNTASVAVIVLQTYSVTATTTSSNGTISEVGTTNVCSGTDKTYVVTPNSGYHIQDVQVDGVSIGNTPPFTIHNVTGPHTITASFAPNCTTPSITATTGAARCGSGSVTMGATASAGTLNWYAASTGGTALHTGANYTPTVSSTTTYYVDATDATCVSARTAVTATVNAVPSATATVTNVSCYGQSTGAVTVTGSGGTAGYTVTGSATSGLPAGTYSYTVTDANGCTAAVSATVTQPSSAVTASSSVTNVSCNGGNNGAVVVSASGGTGSYTGTGTFSSLSAGSFSYTVTDANGCSATTSGSITQPDALVASASVTDPLCNGDPGSINVTASGGTGSYTGTGSFVGLSAGTHNYTVTDVNGCSATASGTITEPSAVVASSSVTNVLCNGGNNGSVVVSASGGTGSFTGTGTFSGLSAGSYSYTVTDANGCSATTSGTIAQPTVLTASSSVTNVLCNGGNNGSVVVSASGGTGSYTGTGTFSELSAGSYSYTVTDANGCTATTSGTITQPSALTASSSVTNVSCNNGSNGTVTVSASGGTSSYTGTGTFSGLSAGSYSYTVTDANGCTATTSGTITQPSALTASSSVTNVSCNNGSNGVVTVSASGGTGSYTGTGTFSGLSAGSYSYTVTDANGCTATASGTITQPSAISVTATPSNVSCNSANGGNHSNGSIATSVSGGTSSYSYAWSGGANGANPSGLATGTYSVTVTDANSCTKTASATIGQPSALSVSLTPTNISCGGTSNGSIAASASGGTASYTYAWSNSATGATCTGLSAGTYSVTVTDANSCTKTGSATVSAATTFTCTITGNSSVLGGVSNTYSGPSGMSSYSWSISGGDHVCDSKCHHHGSHSCGTGCDHHGHSCHSGCHHHGSHSCSNNHTGDHHCNIFCHHHSGHSCHSRCDHNGHSCNSNCHHHSSHNCNHQHCGNTSISGSSTGSSVTVVSPCCATNYTLTLTATNSTGCTSTANMAVTVTPSATITVYSTLYTVGTGWHPSITKSVLAADIKVYTRSTSRKRNGNQSDYATVWNSSTGRVTNIAISSPTTVSMGGGPAYKYTVTVPADGRYLVIGKSSVSSSRCSGGACTVYTGKKVGANDDCDGDQHGRDDDDDNDLDDCSDTKVRFHAVIKDQSGRCREADTRQEHGSLMLVVAPWELDFEDSVSYLPLIYESVEGDWSVSTTAEPPYGFYTEPSGELSASVTDSVIDAVQFSVIDTGSEWTFTTVKHSIAHKGEDRIAYSKPAMVNERTNKPVEVNLTPNPATDQVRIAMPKFEGRATIYIYDLLGQVVAQKPVELISGATTSMDLSALTPGVYMLSAENTQGKASARLIINAK